MYQHKSALQLFEELYGKSLGGTHASPSLYPTLSSMVKEGMLPFIDFQLAQILCDTYQCESEGLCALVSFLSLTSRQGHLNITLESNRILPEIGDILTKVHVEENLNPAVSEKLLKSYQDLILGTTIPNTFVTVIQDPWQQVSTPLCKWNNTLYLQRNWFHESFLHKHYNRIVQQKVSGDLKLGEHSKLLPEQASAVQNALRHPFAIIAGGPGTGKTYTAGMVIRTLWNCLTAEQKQHYKIALAAPTGKAAAQLEKSINTFCAGLFPPIKAQTLHSLLNLKQAYKSFTDEWATLDADFVLIDESSMLDVRMAAHLFAGLKDGARLVMLGDPHQLPPVENGAPFTDLVEHHTRIQSSIVTTLKKCMRAELQEIVILAEKIDLGDSAETLKLLNSNSHVKRLDMQDPLKEILIFYPQYNKMDELEAFAALRSFCVLSSLRKGPLGVNEINAQVEAHFNKYQREIVKIPIIITSNSAKWELSNGDLGILVKRRNAPVLTKEDYAVFGQPGGEGYRKVSALFLPQFEYAYCLTVHKSQGSEFDHVCVLLPGGSEVFGREVLYTAVTRAKKRLSVVAEDETLRKTIGKTGKRVSGRDWSVTGSNR